MKVFRPSSGVVVMMVAVMVAVVANAARVGDGWLWAEAIGDGG